MQNFTSHRIFQYDEDIGYLFNPNLKIRVPHESGGYLITTNSYGFRDADWSEDDKRPIISVFGDSFTAGDGVSNGYRWVDHLASMFPEYSFRNYGISGTGTDQQYLIWKKFARKNNSKFVIIGLLVENIRRNVSAFRPYSRNDHAEVYRAKPYFDLDHGRLILKNTPVPNKDFHLGELDPKSVDMGGSYPWLRKFAAKIGLRNFLLGLKKYQPYPEYNSNKNFAWKLMENILSAWSSELSCPLIVIPIPLYQHIENMVDSANYSCRFNELGTKYNINVINPLENLKNYDDTKKRKFRFEVDVHLTRSGHEALANAISQNLKKIIET